MVIAKRFKLSMEELDMFTMQDFFDYIYAEMGEDKDAPRMANQDDIDAFYRG